MKSLNIFKYRKVNLQRFGKVISVLVIVGGMLVGCNDDSEEFEQQETDSQEETDSQLFTQVAIWGTISDSGNPGGSGGGYGGDYGGGSGGSNEDPGTFSNPNGVTYDVNNNLYTTEFDNNREPNILFKWRTIKLLGGYR